MCAYNNSTYYYMCANFLLLSDGRLATVLFLHVELIFGFKDLSAFPAQFNTIVLNRLRED